MLNRLQWSAAEVAARRLFGYYDTVNRLRGEPSEAPDGAIAALMKTPGTAVLAVDLRGFGETATPSTRAGFDRLIGADWKETTLAMLLEKSYVGMRVDDIAQCVACLPHQLDGPIETVKLKPPYQGAIDKFTGVLGKAHKLLEQQKKTLIS